MLIGAWRLHQELIKAARRSLQAPGGITLQDLLPFQVSVTQDPYIDILVDDRSVARVQFSLTLEYEVRAMLPEIRACRLVALHDGHCDVTATLAIEDQQIASRSMRFELPGAIRLGAGLRLLPAEEYAAAARPRAGAAARRHSQGGGAHGRPVELDRVRAAAADHPGQQVGLGRADVARAVGPALAGVGRGEGDPADLVAVPPPPHDVRR